MSDSSSSSDKIQVKGADGRRGRNREVVDEPAVCVSNLSYETQWQELKDAFRKAGQVTFCDLIANKDGRPSGSALVCFSNEESAQSAIATFHQTLFDGRTISVRKCEPGPRPMLVGRQHRRPRKDRREDDRQDRRRDDRREDRPRRDDRPRHDDRARHEVHVHQDDATAKAAVEVPRPRSVQEGQTRTLFVSNLPFECNWQALKDTFNQVGHVQRAEIIVDRRGRSKGMGTVTFASSEEAELALQEFDGIEMAGRAMNVRFDRKVTRP